MAKQIKAVKGSKEKKTEASVGQVKSWRDKYTEADVDGCVIDRVSQNEEA